VLLGFFTPEAEWCIYKVSTERDSELRRSTDLGLFPGCRHSIHQKLGSTGSALATDDAVSTLTAEEGANSARIEEREAAQLGLGSAISENASGVSQHLMPRLRSMLDLEEHDSLSPIQIKVFQTPRGTQLCLTFLNARANAILELCGKH